MSHSNSLSILCLVFASTLPAMAPQGSNDPFTGVWSGASKTQVVVYACSDTYSGVIAEPNALTTFKLAKDQKDTLTGQVCVDGANFEFTLTVNGEQAKFSANKKTESLERTNTDPFEAVSKLIDAKNYGTAWQHLRPLVDQGQAHSLFVAGLMVQNGWGAPKSFEKSNEFYQRALDAGSVFAPNNLGVSYREGRGVEKDLEKALAAFQIGGIRGDDQAALNAGALLLNGNGLEIDMVRLRLALHLHRPECQGSPRTAPSEAVRGGAQADEQAGGQAQRRP